MRRTVLLAALPGLLCAALIVLAPRSDILTTIAVNAAPARVWAVLIDTAAYPDWNPMIAGLKGELVAGSVIENIEGYGDEQRIFWPTVLAAIPEQELRWRGRLWGLPGLFVGEHYFLLHPTATGTLFTQGEHFTGALLWMFDVRQLMPLFEGMNIGVKRRAEHEEPRPSGR